MKRAIVIGCDGQDGKILFDQLKQKRYSLLGIDKQTIRCFKMVWKQPVDIQNSKKVFELIQKIKPDEIYYLAAFHHSSEDKSQGEMALFKKSFAVNAFALINIFEGIVHCSKKTKIFYAASSFIFGNNGEKARTENSQFDPDTIYGISKLCGLSICRYYRKKHGVFASVGILFSHESIYRAETYLSKKIIKGAVNIKKGKQEKLTIGNLKSENDWGYAPDYVDAMFRIMQLKAPDDFVVATGKKHSVLEFVKIAFSRLGLEWQKHIREDKSVLTRKRKALIGNPKKLMRQTSWKPGIDFGNMIKTLIDQQMEKRDA